MCFRHRQSILRLITTLCVKRVAKNLLKADFVPTRDQVVDGFTKALAVRQLENFKHNLNLGKLWLRETVKQYIVTCQGVVGFRKLVVESISSGSWRSQLPRPGRTQLLVQAMVTTIASYINTHASISGGYDIFTSFQAPLISHNEGVAKHFKSWSRPRSRRPWRPCHADKWVRMRKATRPPAATATSLWQNPAAQSRNISVSV